MSVLPNLIYIGPDKAASTWFFQLFRAHPDIFVTPAKDLYFFDRYFEKGMDWYLQQFEGGEGHQIVAEISTITSSVKPQPSGFVGRFRIPS